MSSTTTRRGLLGGTIAAAAGTPALAHAQSANPASIAADFKIVRRGRAIAAAPRAGILVVAHDARQTIAIAGRRGKRLVDVGGQPLEVAISPKGRLAAVTTASWDEPGLAIVDLAEAKLLGRIDVGAAPFGVAFAAGGTRLVVSGGEEKGEILIIDAEKLKVLSRKRVGTCPRSVAALPGSETAWVAINGHDRVVAVDTRTGKIGRALQTPPLPDRVAVSRSGDRLLVSHAGPDSELVTELPVGSRKFRRHRAGRLPSGVAWGGRGQMLVALAGEGKIALISATGRRSTRKVGGSPRGLAVAGPRAFTVDALSGEIGRVKL